MKFWALLIAGAVLPFLFDTALPVAAAPWLILVFSLLGLPRSLKAISRPILLVIAVFVFASLSIQHRLSQRLTLQSDKTLTEISGKISNLPEYNSEQVRFLFLVDNDQDILPGNLIRVSWHIRNAPAGVLPELHVGETWRLPLQLRTTRGQVNFVGADSERWSFARGLAARAYVHADDGRLLQRPSRFDPGFWRETALRKLNMSAADAPMARMISALAVADRRSLSVNDRHVLAATGTGHLLAISGLHIGLAAVMGFYFGRALLFFIFRGAGLKLAVFIPWALAWLSALAYSVLAGFGVSTQRALIMLSVATLVMLSRRKVHPLMAWLMAMGLVLLIDPFAPLRAGFWFSFIAVAILLLQFSPRFGALPGWQKVLQAQFAISLIMAPLGMYWFQQASAPGLLANLVAIPLVSFVTVPLILLGLILMWLPTGIAGVLFYAAGFSVQVLFRFLEKLSAWQPDSMTAVSTPSLMAVILAMLGAAIIVMPRGLPGRLAGVLLMLPVLLPAANPVSKNHMLVDMLDVGQGLAVLAGSHNFLMLYDTGPGSGLMSDDGWDTVASTIQPAIAARAIPLDLVVVSHADMDHAGGLVTLQNIWPQTRIVASVPHPRPGVRACRSGKTQLAGNIVLRTLHPAEGLPYLGNDSSCVISMTAPGFSLLLTGDISKSVENRLLMQDVSHHRLMTVPHHGSASSSSSGFVRSLQPEWALVSAEANNRFDLPRPEVLQRFAAAGTRVLNTADCGGIRLTSTSFGVIKVRSARQQRDAIWRFKAGDFCP